MIVAILAQLILIFSLFTQSIQLGSMPLDISYLSFIHLKFMQPSFSQLTVI